MAPRSQRDASGEKSGVWVGVIAVAALGVGGLAFVRSTRNSESSFRRAPVRRPDDVSGTTIKKVGQDLEEASKRQRRMALRFGWLAGVVGIVGIVFLYYTAVIAFGHIDDGAREGLSDAAVAAETTFLLVRGTGLAGIIGGLVYFASSLSRSAIDQATRYEKRFIASHLIDYALHDPEVRSDRLDAAYKIIEVWGSTVESAYTPPRVAKRVGGMRVAVGKEQASLESDPRQP